MKSVSYTHLDVYKRQEPPAGDATNDSNVVVEEKEETPPLTPKGNATLVDDYGGNKMCIRDRRERAAFFHQSRRTAGAGSAGNPYPAAK